jgi:hypothetical protein
VAAGSNLVQPPHTLINTANAFTRKYFTKLLPDSVFKPSPTWWSLTRLGKKIEGGGAIVWGPITSEEMTGGAYTGLQLLDTTPTDPISPAELQWKSYQQAIIIPVLDYLMNQGEGQVLPLVRIKEETAMGSLLQKLSRAQYGVAPNNTALDLDSIPSALGSLGGTYAGLTNATATQWASNGGAGPSSGSALSFANMQSDYGSATYGNEEPDRIFMTQNGYNALWNLMVAGQRFIKDEETTRAGFKMHLMFNNATVMHDQFVPAGEVIMLTSKYVRPVFLANDYFNVDDFIQPGNQRVLISRIYVTMNLQFLTLRQHARRTGVTNG